MSKSSKNKENIWPIVQLKKLDLQDLILKGAKIIKDESRILQEQKYFLEEDFKSDDGNSEDVSPDESDEDYHPEEDEPNFKNKCSEHKRDELTEYERMVQKNKEEKMAFLKSLQMDEIKGSFAEAVKGLKPKPKKYIKKLLPPPRINKKRSAKVRNNLSEDALVAKMKFKAYEYRNSVKKSVQKKIKSSRNKPKPKGNKRRAQSIWYILEDDFKSDDGDSGNGSPDDTDKDYLPNWAKKPSSKHKVRRVR